MSSIRLVVVPLLAVVASAAAQDAVISPVGAGYATRRGTGVHWGPFAGSKEHVWQQVHGDLRGQPRSIGALRFRQGADVSTALPRVATGELWMGDGDHTNVWMRFENNYVGVSRTLVMGRRPIRVPSFAQIPAGGWPAPFSITLPLDAPYPHSGKHALVWEVRVTDIDVTGLTFLDYHDWRPDTVAAKSSFGTGCVASTTVGGERHYMENLVSVNYDRREYGFSWRSFYGVDNAPTAIVIGLDRTDLPVPGLCTNVYVANVVAEIMGISPPSGNWSTPMMFAPYAPALAGVRLETQTLCVDLQQAGGTLPLCASRGQEVVLPALGPAPFPVSCVHRANKWNAASGNVYRGSILITEFD